MVREIDVGGLSFEACRDRIDGAFDGTETGEPILVVADRDVGVALRQYELRQARPLHWEYETEGPDRWALHVTDGEDDEKRRGPVEFDVRQLPPWERAAVVRETVDLLPTGDEFLLVSRHDPDPFVRQVRDGTDDRLRLEYRWRRPGAFRVLVESVPEGESGASTGQGETTF